MTRIAYAGHDGRIHVLDEQGRSSGAATPTQLECSWPTPSRDGTRIAFSGFNILDISLGAFVYDLESGRTRKVYANEKGSSIIARNTPHYLNWSPDGNKLGIVAQRGNQGLAMYVAETPDYSLRSVSEQGPLYSSWSHDSRLLFLHSFYNHFLMDFQYGTPPAQIPGNASSYMTPAWNPVRAQIAFCRDERGGRQSLVVGDFSSSDVQFVHRLEGICAFQWRPDGESLALIKDVDRSSGYFSGIWQIDPPSQDALRIVNDPVLCFFWSPQGDRIAYITPSDGADGSVRWAVKRLDRAEPVYLEDFRPTQEQLTSFMFFDQYAQSHNPWSPDGTRLIFSGRLGYQQVRTDLPVGPENAVFVAECGDAGSTAEIAKGNFGVWLPS